MAKTLGRMTRVAKVAAAKPPMTARPRGATCSPPSPMARAMGTMPAIMAQAGMTVGRSPRPPAPLNARSRENTPHFVAAPGFGRLTTHSQPGTLRKRHQKNRMGHRHTNGHDRTHERLNVQSGARQPQEHRDAGDD